jgi:hypothetical protein
MRDVRRIAIALGWSLEVWQDPERGEGDQWYSRLLNDQGDCVDDFGPFARPSTALGAVLLDLINGKYDYQTQIDDEWDRWGWAN